MNTKRESSVPLVRKLLHDGIALNVTTIFTLQQAQDIVYAVKGDAPCYVSVSAGRIADTGRDPVPLMADAVERLKEAPNARDQLCQRLSQEAIAGRQGYG